MDRRIIAYSGFEKKKFKPLPHLLSEFFAMFNLHVSNNCDVECEQGDGSSRTADEVRKLRYFKENGPVDIIYGEVSCFQRDILLSELNKTDESLDIMGSRIKGAEVSVIVDEVDSMLLDKASMVLYLSHSIDTLRALERVFVTIWQIINSDDFNNILANMIDDDLINIVSDMVFDQIASKQLEIPEYEVPQGCEFITMRGFVKRRMHMWVRSAFHVKVSK